MIILTIRTDKPDSEIGIFEDSKKLGYEIWEAHRHLAETLHDKLKALLDSVEISLSDVGGVVIFAGPGSFTGLRIGFSVANALAYSNTSPITAAGGEDWIESGISVLRSGKGEKSVIPEYGMPANITTPKK